MVAFVLSILIGSVVLAIPFRLALRRRPVGAPLTWGQAMVASVWSFFLMFWWYGVVPHQWLTWADNELNWRKDKRLYGPGNIVDNLLPFDVNYLIVRDIIVVGIYVVILAGAVVLWMQWQNRGKRKPTTDVVPSRYGRPLVKA